METKKRKPATAEQQAKMLKKQLEKQNERIKKLKENKGKEVRKKSSKPASDKQLAARAKLKKVSDLATKLQKASGLVTKNNLCNPMRYKLLRVDAMKQAWKELYPK